MEVIKILQFGSPTVQKEYQHLCDLLEIPFEDFQDKLIEDTGKTYDQLKEYFVDGEPYQINEYEFEEFEPVTINNFLIIHFNTNTREILGIIPNEYDVYTDGEDYYESPTDIFDKLKEIRNTTQQYI